MNKEDKKKNKQQRLAQALRRNLKRRKEQTTRPSETDISIDAAHDDKEE